MSEEPVRDRLVSSAFELFEVWGYERTTIDEIAEHAKVGRTSFFRYFRTKEAVLFPEHDHLLERVRARLGGDRSEPAISAVVDAARLVLQNYVDEGARARQRYALGKTVSALRDWEIVSAARYQRIFREYLNSRSADQPDSARRAELTAAVVIAANNHVIRRWLRGDAADPMAEFDEGMADVMAMARVLDDQEPPNTTVVMFHSDMPASRIHAAIEQALSGDGS